MLQRTSGWRFFPRSKEMQGFWRWAINVSPPLVLMFTDVHWPMSVLSVCIQDSIWRRTECRYFYSIYTTSLWSVIQQYRLYWATPYSVSLSNCVSNCVQELMRCKTVFWVKLSAIYYFPILGEYTTFVLEIHAYKHHHVQKEILSTYVSIVRGFVVIVSALTYQQHENNLTTRPTTSRSNRKGRKQDVMH